MPAGRPRQLLPPTSPVAPPLGGAGVVWSGRAGRPWPPAAAHGLPRAPTAGHGTLPGRNGMGFNSNGVALPVVSSSAASPSALSLITRHQHLIS
jgi:hypothetical protein